MKRVSIFNLFIAVITIVTFSACSEYIENALNNKSDKRIGMPTSVSNMNVELSRSRAAGERVAPDMRTTVSEDGKLFCKFTSTPSINPNRNTAMPLHNKN